MYRAPLDAKKVAQEAVDAVRETTNAPLAQCHEAVLEVLRLLSPHIDNTAFSTINQEVLEYEPNIDNCYDLRTLSSICETLYEIFMEKQELSYSSSQNDGDLCKGLEIFCDITRKTDPRIPLKIVSAMDFDWISQLLTVLQMDQDTHVRLASIEAITALLPCSETIQQMLIESRLPIILVDITSLPFNIEENSPSEISPFKRLQINALKLLSKLYTTNIPPTLDHLNYLNSEYFARLFQSLKFFDGTDVFELCVNLIYVLDETSLSFSAVTDPIINDPIACTDFGHVVISEINQKVTKRRLHFLEQIINLGKNVLEDMFYSNDLGVLARVLARECLNQEEQSNRRLCSTCLRKLVELDITGIADDSLVTEALEQN
ncbi:unnamed protein product [Caenorhabditis bovis]|uniref:SPIN90/Ldb17 leucine-rich domain-containing protein n=1 Tax=Caenorhabditis bovis TaxID=2654633 RepID=A0A8S1F1F3_9PELO|nr:unnamed protein product [Caenorhabditis bovis]